jgi:Mce-associated membrane protein
MMASGPTDASASGKTVRVREAEVSAAEAEALAAEAEAEAAEAEAQAAQARARAAALRAEREAAVRAEAEAKTRDAAEAAAAEEATAATSDSDLEIEDADTETRRRLLRRPRWQTAASAAVVLVICALVAFSGYMVWQNHQSTQRQMHEAEFSAAARQGVVNLMSLNFAQGDADIQRLIDGTTGSFRDDFEKSKNDFLTVMKDSKVVTTAEVKATGVESMSGNSAVVLVTATSQVSNAASSKQSPRAWRLSVTLDRVDGQPKMSKVEFVP